MRATLWPAGLVGRVSIVLFAAVLLELVGSTLFFERAEILSGDEAHMRHIAEQLGAAGRAIGVADPLRRSKLAGALSGKVATLEWRPAAGQGPIPAPNGRAKALRDTLISYDGDLAKGDLRVEPVAPRATEFTGSLRLADGSRLGFSAVSPDVYLPSLYGQLGSVIVLSGCVLLAALLVVRTLAAPLRMLVHATRAIGRGPPIAIEETGPREIRRVARAFNAMQDRIAKLIADRTQALAAVSHDLRTPIGRLRLRAGFLAAPEDRAAFETDLAEMESMLDDLLAYLGGETDPEKPKRTDIAAMLTTLVDAATDAGRNATYDGPDHLVVEVRSLAMKRAFSNLINNAIAYGDRASVTARATESSVTVTVEDDGPGIPATQFATVFEPFVRLEASRNRATGGMGLGLAITRAAILREGASITLSNRSEGGLRVTVTVPQKG